MSIREEITNQLKEAMINKNTNLVNTLRLIKASIKDKDIIAKGNGKGDITDQEIISVLQTMIKQRKASIEMYSSGNREDLVTKEESEIKIISNFLPEQLSSQEIETVINELIISSGASSIKNIGNVIKLVKEKYEGRIDLGVASKLIKEKLSEI
tara:strand:- start:125 stop:586 length:462 start_codon:yes stop_codon:yes gene_type:complete